MKAGLRRNPLLRRLLAQGACADRRAAGPLRLQHRGLFLLPTGLGATFGLLLLAMLLAAMNYASSMAYAMTFLLTGLALSAICDGHRNLLGLRVDRAACDAVFSGQRAVLRYRLHNDRPYPRREIRLLVAGEASAPVDLEPGEERELEVSIPTARRGELRIADVTIQSHHPGRLLRAWARLAVPQTVTVYPRPASPAAATSFPSAPASLGTAAHAGDEDFAGLRGFHPGDRLRHIDWKAYARRDALQVKQFSAPPPESRWLSFDDVPGSVEQRLSRLCRAALDAEQEGLAFGLRLPHLTLPPADGRTQLERVLRALALHPETR